MLYKTATETDGRVIAFTVSGDTATAGTPVAMGTNTDNNEATGLKKISTDKFAIASVGASSIYAQVGTISGTTITLGTEVQISTATSANSSEYTQMASPATDVFVVRFNSSSTVVGAVACTVSGTTPTAGTPIDNIGAIALGPGGVYAESATSLLFVGGSQICRVALSGTTLTEGQSISSFSQAFIAIIAMDNSYWVATNAPTTALIITIQGMSNNYIGFIQTTTANAGTGAVSLVGIDSNQSGLTAGVTYLITDGGLSAVASDVVVNTLNDIDVVKAISATSIIIK